MSSFNGDLSVSEMFPETEPYLDLNDIFASSFLKTPKTTPLTDIEEFPPFEIRNVETIGKVIWFKEDSFPQRLKDMKKNPFIPTNLEGICVFIHNLIELSEKLRDVASMHRYLKIELEKKVALLEKEIEELKGNSRTAKKPRN